MNRKKFWGIFAATQVMGTLGVLTGSPHGFAVGLVIAAIALFPGSILCLFLLDFLGVDFGTWRILVTALPINLVCWYAVRLTVRKIRGEKSTC